MAGRLGIIACAGALPPALAEADPAAFVAGFEGIETRFAPDRITLFRLEKMGGLVKALKAEGVTRLVLAGALTRPRLDPKALDTTTMMLAPKVMSALNAGDDGLLRVIVEFFEKKGFEVLGAHQVRPDLTAPTGLIAGPAPDKKALADIARGAQILSTLSPLDLGQGCVVAGGLCLGIETLQGTDALIDFVARTPDRLRRAPATLVKAPKAGQDLRIDMPAIGPKTIASAQAAGLATIALAAGRVLLLEREATLAAAREAGITIYGADI